MSNIRRWLETNKIFFETFAVTVLALMAMIISFVIGIQQTTLIKLQTEIAHQELQNQERSDRLARTSDWARLRTITIEILQYYPNAGF